MRSKKWLVMLAGVGVCTLMLDASRSYAQRFGPPRGGFDPESRWAELVQSSGGSGDTLQLERLPPDARERMRRLATFTGQAPLPDTGLLTKAQYLDYVQRGIQSMKDKGMGMGGPPGGGMGGPPGGGEGGAPGGPGFMFSRGGPSSNSPEEILRRFQEYDKNKDGKLAMDEASSRTKENFANFDANKDGFLDLQEYTTLRQTVYGGPPGATPGSPPFASMSGSTPPPWAQGSTPPPTTTTVATTTSSSSTKSEPPGLVAYRFGKIPKEAPSWFSDLDTDRDGQIGLYEWMKAKRDMAEFTAMDLNNDGFVTPEEWLRAQKLTQERQKQDDLVASVTENNSLPDVSRSRSSASESMSRGPWGSRGTKDSGSAASTDKSDRKDMKRGFGGFPKK